jgi:hypothetical protein
VPVPVEIKPAPWQPWPEGRHQLGSVEGHSFRLLVDGGFCAGEERSKIDHVRVVERPKTKGRPFKSAVITGFKYRPEHQEGRQTEEEIRNGKVVFFGVAPESAAS